METDSEGELERSNVAFLGLISVHWHALHLAHLAKLLMRT